MFRLRIVAMTLSVACLVRTANAQIARGASKYLGNITTLGAVPADFGDYWNQIAPETECKWPSVEGTRDHMNWTGADRVSNYAKAQGIPWTVGPMLAAGSYPGWMAAISPDTLKTEIQEWFDLTGARFPEAAMVKVVSEFTPGHSGPGIIGPALGGTGTTGYDWMIEAFRMARRAFPKASLILNDYNIVEYGTDNAAFLKAVRALLAAKAPIDGIGCETHEAYRRPMDTLRKYMDSLASTGLPIHITEYDIDVSNDARQDSIMEVQFPFFWNHPAVAGITYWGYVMGKTWRAATGLKSQDGVERPALVWLKSYVAAHPNPPTPVQNTTGIVGTGDRVTESDARLELRNVDGHLRLGLRRGHEFLPIGSAGRTRNTP